MTYSMKSRISIMSVGRDHASPTLGRRISRTSWHDGLRVEYNPNRNQRKSAMKRNTSYGLTALVGATALAALCTQDVYAKPPTVLSDIVGTWQNVNPSTPSIIKIVVSGNGSALTVHGFGACSPTPCDR